VEGNKVSPFLFTLLFREWENRATSGELYKLANTLPLFSLVFHLAFQTGNHSILNIHKCMKKAASCIAGCKPTQSVARLQSLKIEENGKLDNR
jgi:hypothetical protein